MKVASSGATTSLITLGLVVLVVAVFGQGADHGFLDLDDSEYVYENPQVMAGLTLDGLAWAFTTTHAANWHPLTWLSHMTDVQIFGPAPGWHHRMSVAIHAANAALLFVVLRGMTGAAWQSAWVAALFAVHPLHVESVAWVAERKDVLSTFFWLLTMGTYARYVRHRGVRRYAGVVISFALGLLAKPMLVTLPLVLLLMDYWPLRRLERPGSSRDAATAWERLPRLIFEKTPLLALAAVSSIVTLVAQVSKGAAASLDSFPIGERAANAVVSCVLYLAKTLWPAGLAAFYPHPSSIHERYPAWQVVGAIAALGVLTLLALRWGRYRPYLAVGWLWFLGTLVPVSGLVQVGSQSMADRYTYVPLIGIFVAVAWGVPDLVGGWRHRRSGLAALGTTVVVVFSMLAWIQAGHWRDNVSLYTHAITVTRANWLAWNNLGNHHLGRGEAPQALASFREALRIKPDYADAWYNTGVALGRLADYPRAIASYREALRLVPTNVDGWVNLGLAYQAVGQHAQAVDCYDAALRLRPEDPFALYGLAGAHAVLGNRGNAFEAYQRLRAVDPGRAAALLKAMGATP